MIALITIMVASLILYFVSFKVWVKTAVEYGDLITKRYSHALIPDCILTMLLLVVFISHGHDVKIDSLYGIMACLITAFIATVYPIMFLCTVCHYRKVFKTFEQRLTREEEDLIMDSSFQPSLLKNKKFLSRHPRVERWFLSIET